MNDYYFTFKYKFNSGTGMEEERYVRDFKMKIIAENHEKQEELLIGKVSFQIIFTEKAINSGFNLFEILDTNEYTLRLGFQLFDFDKQEIKDDIQKHFGYNIIKENICIIKKIEILPQFRGHNLAAKAIKDMIFHFGSVCGLFAIQPYPLQFEVKRDEQSNWQKQLELTRFATNEKVAFKKLEDYYKSFGFEKIKGYNDVLFYNPELINEKMDSIDLEE